MSRLLLLIIICIILAGCGLFQSSQPILVEYPGYRLSSNGPIILDFQTPMVKDTVEERIHIKPVIDVTYAWRENWLLIFPKAGFEPSRQYQLFFTPGSETESGQILKKNLHWDISIHPLCVIFIGNVTNSPELWRFCKGENEPLQITNSDGKVIDYETSYDGNIISFITTNEKDGTEIWIVNRDGLDQELIIDCGEIQCADVTISADNRWLAFSRLKSRTSTKTTFSTYEIIITDLKDHQEFELFENETLLPSGLQFSPRGNSLSFYDENSKSFWIIDLDTQMINMFESDIALGGSWISDGSGFIFVTPQFWGGIPYDLVQSWDVFNNSIQSLFGDASNQFEYLNPQKQPGGDWYLVGTRPIRGGVTKQLSLIMIESNNILSVTDMQNFTHTAYSWSPDGRHILFQRFEMGNPDAIPEILIWDLGSQDSSIISIYASNPKWLP